MTNRFLRLLGVKSNLVLLSWLIRTGVGHLVPKGPHLVDDKQFEILLGALMDEVEKQSGNKLKVNVSVTVRN